MIPLRQVREASKRGSMKEPWVVREEEEWDALSSFVGHRIVSAHHFSPKDSAFCEGILFKFDDGRYLTARDGEYGDNAFEEVDAQEAEKLISQTEERLRWEKCEHY